MTVLPVWPFFSAFRRRTGAVVIPAMLLAFASPLSAQFTQRVQGRFVAHVVDVKLPNGAVVPPQVINQNDATVQLAPPNQANSWVQLPAATIQIKAPLDTPVGTQFGDYLVPADHAYVTFIPGPVYPEVSVSLSATMTVAQTPAPPAGATLSASGSLFSKAVSPPDIGTFGRRLSRQDASATPGTHLLSSSGEAEIVEGDLEYQDHTGFSPRTRRMFQTPFTVRGSGGGTSNTWMFNVYTYYEFTEVDTLSVSSPVPSAGTAVEDGAQQPFSATVSYKLVTQPVAEIAFEATNAAGEVVGSATRLTVNQAASEQNVTMQIPAFTLRLPMQTITLTASLISNGAVTRTAVITPPYPVVVNEVAIHARTPAEETLKSGTSVAFSVDLDYWLRTRLQANLIVELLRQNGEVVGSSPVLGIWRGDAPQRTVLTVPTIAILNEYRTLALRVRMTSAQTILREALQTTVYLIDPVKASAGYVKVVSITGDAELIRTGSSQQIPLVGGETLSSDDRIVTGLESEVVVALGKDSIVRIKELTDVKIASLLEGGEDAVRTRLWLKAGEVSAEINNSAGTRSDFAIKTPTATCSVRGTALTVRHVTQPTPLTTVTVTESTVETDPFNAWLDSFLLTAGQSAQVSATKVSSSFGPAITNLNPSSGTAGTTQVTVTGTGFGAAPADNMILFGGVGSPVTTATATQLTATVPDGLATGTVPLEVRANGFTSNSMTFDVVASHPPTAVSGNVSGTWTRVLSPYSVTGDATILAGQGLNIEPGTVILFAAGAALHVQGILAAPGTAVAPIRFTSGEASKAAGQWGGIKFHDTSNDAITRLSHCVVEFAGGAPFPGPLQFVSASPRIDFCTVSSNLGDGMHLNASDPVLSGCVITGNAGSALWLENTSFPVLDDNLAVANGRDTISVAAQTLSRDGTWKYDDIPYLLRGDVQVAAGKTLTVAAGAEIMAIAPDTDLIVDGTLLARGSIDRSITFTSDEAPALQVPGQWGALVFQAGGTGSVLEHCVVEFGGGSRNGQLELLGSSPAIADCLVHRSATDGLFASTSATQVERSRFLGNMRDGIRSDAATTFAVHNSVIAGNTGRGINNLSTQFLAAQSNFWGNASGPLDTSNADGAGLLNPTGTGSAVSEYVTWSNFLIAEPATATTQPALDLQILKLATGEVAVSWAATVTGATLQKNADLKTGQWLPAGLQTTTTGGRTQAIIPSSEAAHFYRLTLP